MKCNGLSKSRGIGMLIPCGGGIQFISGKSEMLALP